MNLVNYSILSYTDIKKALQNYPIELDPSGEVPTFEDGQGIFVNDSRGLLVTDDTYKNYGGLTYEYGATSVYDVSNTIKRLGESLGKRVIFLRIIHECAHHFGLPADSIDEWFKNHPIWSIIYHIFGKPYGENWISCYIQELYYAELFSSIVSETYFNNTYDIKNRTYNGLLEN